MKTATIEVKYVNPPKEGKQYGSIKGANNDSWPVKADRIREFEPGNTYELAYTESEKGFKNIIGVKRIVPQTAEPEPRSAQTKPPQQNGYYQPRPTAPKDSERMWTCAILGHYVDRGDVPLHKESVKAAINLLREAYQETYGQDDKSPAVIPGEFQRMEVAQSQQSKPRQQVLPMNDDLYGYAVPVNVMVVG